MTVTLFVLSLDYRVDLDHIVLFRIRPPFHFLPPPHLSLLPPPATLPDIIANTIN